MSGFSRGVADGMLLNDLASSQSAAASAERDAYSARAELRRYKERTEEELASWRKFSEELKGVRDGYRALLQGFHRTLKAEMGEGANYNAYFGKSVKAARDCLSNLEDFSEVQASNAISIWKDERMRAPNDFYCLVPMPPPGPSPVAPTPPNGIEIVKRKRFFFFPYTRYSVGDKEYKRKKRALDALLALSKEYDEIIVPNWQAAMKKHEAYVKSYENQQRNLIKYGLNA